MKSQKIWVFFPVLTILVLGSLLFRCGSSSDDNNDDSPQNEPNPNSLTPTGWDGTSDWQDSPFEVTDE